MVPEKTRAAQDETSEEQRSGKPPVREGRRAQKGGERGRGAAGRCAALLCGYRCSDSLPEWRVRAWGGSGQQRYVCPHALRFVLINSVNAVLCWPRSFSSANAGGRVVLPILLCSAPGPRSRCPWQMPRGLFVL